MEKIYELEAKNSLTSTVTKGDLTSKIVHDASGIHISIGNGEKAPEFFDPVSIPSHYAAGRKYEPRKVISDWGLNFNLGNGVKYISRADREGDAIQDLEKAIQYIQFELEELKEVRDQNESTD